MEGGAKCPGGGEAKSLEVAFSAESFIKNPNICKLDSAQKGADPGSIPVNFKWDSVPKALNEPKHHLKRSPHEARKDPNMAHGANLQVDLRSESFNSSLTSIHARPATRPGATKVAHGALDHSVVSEDPPLKFEY